MLLVARQCPAGRGCSTWIHKYLHDCVCSARDAVSFSFGLVSVMSWGIAEVPQIVTNFKEKSTEGVSLIFLMTWVVGDFFNLAGCFLEPATLPTQFYMAALYTGTTLILLGQTIYYGRRKQPPEKEPLLPSEQKHPSGQTQQPTTTGSEVPAASGVVITAPAVTVPSPQRRKFITSARSLASSHTPTVGSFLSSSSVRGVSYLGSQPSTLEASQSQPINIVRAVATGVFMLGSVGLCSSQHHLEDREEQILTSGIRRLLQESEKHSILGEMFGWAMAAIYMGGRFPQIWLNMTRGTVEGLNPLMFLFALVGNATYVASILIRSIAWKRLKPNLPWLVDAAVCVVLDFFIMAQFCYYCYFKKEKKHHNDDESK